MTRGNVHYGIIAPKRREGQKKEGEEEDEEQEKKVGMCVLVSMCLHTKARGCHWMFSVTFIFQDRFLKLPQKPP